jgi:hypothetical protein
MILGMTAFTLFHVLLSLIGILSGFVVVFGLVTGKRLNGWTILFLTTTVATSATGFLFPYHGFKPSYAVGIVSLVVLAIAIFALYGRGLAGGLAPDLRCQRSDCSLPKCFCFNCPAFHEGSRAQGSSPHPIGAAISGDPGRCSIDFHSPWVSGG